MNILQVCNKTPYPVKDGGAFAMAMMYQGMNSQFNTDLLVVETPKHRIPADKKDSIYSAFIDTRIKAIPAIVNLLFSKAPYNLQRFISVNFANKLIQLLKQKEYHLVLLESLYVLPYITTIRQYSHAKIVYRAHNVEHEIWNDLCKNEKNSIKKYYLRTLARRIRNYEYTIINKVDGILSISESDYIFFSTHSHVPVYNSPTGININNKAGNKADGCCGIGYIGSLDWLPNQEALLWFIDKVWQPFFTADNGQKLVVAGRGCPQWLKSRISLDSISFLGELENVNSFYQQVGVVVIPLFSGSGMRIRIIESMAMGKVVITTRAGVQGISAEHGKHLFIANNANDFKHIIQKLLSDTTSLNQVKENAYNWVKNNYNNQRIVENTLSFLNNSVLKA